MAHKDRVPGTYKSTATFEGKRDKAFDDTKVEDEGYSYTSLSFPGFMGQERALTSDEAKHVVHKPLTSDRRR